MCFFEFTLGSPKLSTTFIIGFSLLSKRITWAWPLLVFLLSLFYSWRVFPISISRWSFTGVWVTASLLKSPGLFPVFWLISIMVWFGQSSPVLLFPSPPVQSFGDCTKSTNYNWYNHHFHISQFFQFPSKVQVLISLFTFFQFYSVVSQDSKVHNSTSSLFFFYYYKVWLSG